jgi:hypothetical protein
MISTQTSTLAPKKALIRDIQKTFSEEEIRTRFNINKKTAIETRLNGKSKPEIVTFLTETDRGKCLLDELEQSYPLHSPPTLYLAHLFPQPDITLLLEKTKALRLEGRDGGLLLKPESKVRAVYVSRQARWLDYSGLPPTIEIPIFYEQRIEYSESNPRSKDFGERKSIYSLEQGFIWLLDGHSHTVICCQGFAPVRPILDFARTFLSFRWALPNLTSEMMSQIALKSVPRSATFSTMQDEKKGNKKGNWKFDVKTVTLSDPKLSESGVFQQIIKDTTRQQTAGFYSDHPIFTFGGLGIARRYARVWTPAHVSKRNYLFLAVDLVEKTEHELSQAYQNDLTGFIRFYQDHAVSVGKHELHGAERDTFNLLVEAIMSANHEEEVSTIDDSLLQTLVSFQKSLGLLTYASLDCPNCGERLAECPSCHLPLQASLDGSKAIILKCPKTKCGYIVNIDDGLLCDCGQEIDFLSAENHVRIFPSPELLNAVENFIGLMDDILMWRGTFMIDGFQLKLIDLSPVQGPGMVSLGEMSAWRSRAHHHNRRVTGKTRELAIQILRLSREKCDKNEYHPHKTDCIACLESQMSDRYLREGKVCLPRMLGLPIEMEAEFDGIHHRYEVADIKYIRCVAQ